MTTSGFESVRSRALPESLMLRMVAGSALDGLFGYTTPEQLTTEQSDAFRAVAKLLRPPDSHEPPAVGSSLGNYQRNIRLMRFAKLVWKRPQEAASKELLGAVTDLEALADRKKISSERRTQLRKILIDFDLAIASYGPSISEVVGDLRP